MNLNLKTIEIAVGILLSVLTILGIFFGWFGKAWRWVSLKFRLRPSASIIDIPKKTMILIPLPRKNALLWHMGKAGDEPGMHIVGDLNVTNISSKYAVFAMGAKLRKPKAIGRIIRPVKDEKISKGSTGRLTFEFFIQPPVCKKEMSFKADVAIIDLFNNEHWLKGLEFQYRGPKGH